jgi:dihydroorotase
MIESILFKDVELITASERKQGDVYVLNGKIVAIQPSLSVDAEYVINEKGLALIPGVIDPHVHFREPGASHKETLYTGSKAAVRGGVTSFFEMPNTKPATIDAVALAEKKKIASQTSLANYNFFIGATTSNLDHLNSVENVPGIKVFVGSSTGNMLVDDQAILEEMFRNGTRLIAVHSEDEATIQANKQQYLRSGDVHDHPKIRNVAAAIKSTRRLVQLATKYQRRLHICHLTTEEEAVFLDQTQSKYVTTEVSPQHLLLWGPECYTQLGTLAQINPPIREKRHADALWSHLIKGTIQCMGSDHAPHTLDEKMKPFGDAPSGMPGVETSLPLLLTLAYQKRCSYQNVVKWLCEAPAAVYGIKNKGQLKEGYDADLTLIDLNKKHTLSNSRIISKCGWTAFDGWSCRGEVIATFVNGQPVYREGDFFETVKGKEIKIK